MFYVGSCSEGIVDLLCNGTLELSHCIFFHVARIFMASGYPQVGTGPACVCVRSLAMVLCVSQPCSYSYHILMYNFVAHLHAPIIFSHRLGVYLHRVLVSESASHFKRDVRGVWWICHTRKPLYNLSMFSHVFIHRSGQRSYDSSLLTFICLHSLASRASRPYKRAC